MSALRAAIVRTVGEKVRPEGRGLTPPGALQILGVLQDGEAAVLRGPCAPRLHSAPDQNDAQQNASGQKGNVREVRKKPFVIDDRAKAEIIDDRAIDSAEGVAHCRRPAPESRTRSRPDPARLVIS